MQKHQVIPWLGRLFVMFTLVVSSGLQADTWIYNPFYPPSSTYTVSEWGANNAQTVTAPNHNAACNLFDPRFPSSSEIGGAIYFVYCGLSAAGNLVSVRYIAPNCPANSSQLNPGDYKGFCFCTPPYVPDILDLYKVTKCIRRGLVITLTADSKVEPSDASMTSTLPIIAIVKDQNGQAPNPGVAVRVSVTVDPKTGGHAHGDSARPRGGIADVRTCASDNECWSDTTDVNGQVVFNFNPTEASGTHTITATCDGCGNTATKLVDVKVDGLNSIPAMPFYALNETNGDVIGARSGWHTDNHNLTPAAALKLLQIASWYRFLPQFKVVVDNKTGRKEFPPILHINDASLPWGGVYDICARSDACPDDGVIAWQKPHAEHRRGTVVDVRANGGDGSIPASNTAKFVKLLQIKKIPYLQENKKTSNEHFHLRLLGNKE